MSTAVDGFWLPQGIRESVLSPEVPYDTACFANGRPCAPYSAGAVTARWPRLRPAEWKRLFAGLRENRRRAPRGREFWERLQVALGAVAKRLAEPSDPLCSQALNVLPSYTGYSEPMIRFMLNALDLMALDQLSAAYALVPSQRVVADWQVMPGLAGCVHFYPASRWQSLLWRLPGFGNRPLFSPPEPPDMVVGYGAGNVPGTALLIALLSQATTLADGAPPAVLVKNSRQEPLFTRLVLEGLEAADAELVSAIAVMIWDYEDAAMQDLMLSQADLVIAAASDETIAQIRADIQRVPQRPRPIRFHAHGHKVSFSAIGKEILARGLRDEASGQPLLNIVTLLAALDSAFWDQNGCLSSRIHFVEKGGDGYHAPHEYAARLSEQLRMLGGILPRGRWPLQQIKDRFDKYKLLETTGQVRVFSGYDDEFLVALDERSLDAVAFRAEVNDCQGRVIIVRPVVDLMELPQRYLRLLSANNLQSLSAAMGQPGEGLTPHMLRFAEACGARGVTAIRTVGRGAFPQLAYSWDGFIPMDLTCQRLAGHFTTIEFDAPYEQILATFHMLWERGAAMGLA